MLTQCVAEQKYNTEVFRNIDLNHLNLEIGKIAYNTNGLKVAVAKITLS